MRKPSGHEGIIELDTCRARMFTPSTVCLEDCTTLYSSLNDAQKQAADSILFSVRNKLPGCFFIDGPGGSGKTYLYKTLYNLLTAGGSNVICTAWTGIAANLMPGGRTVSSMFKLNIKENNRSSSLKREQKEARALHAMDLLI